MEANELRLGNWVYYQDNCPLKSIILNFDRMKSVFFDEKWASYYLSPIPLTEEWLLKFGFVFLTDIGVYKLKFKIDTQAGEYEFAGVPKAIGFVSNRLFASGTIKYVHQLQNLYFALTGNELTIK